MRRQEQQAGLALSGVAAPLGEPLDHLPAVGLAVAKFTGQILDTLSEQRPPTATRLPLHPVGDVGDPDNGVGTPPEPVGQTLRFAQPPNVRRMVGCRLDRNPPRRAIAPNGLKLAPGAGDDRCLGPRPSPGLRLEPLQLAHREDSLDGPVLGHAQDLHAPPPELVEPRKLAAPRVLPSAPVHHDVVAGLHALRGGRDKHVGRIDDVGSRAVVLDQVDRARGKVRLEAPDERDGRPLEGVYVLVVVADREQAEPAVLVLGGPPGDGGDQFVLVRPDVLVLVDQDPAVSLDQRVAPRLGLVGGESVAPQ